MSKVPWFAASYADHVSTPEVNFWNSYNPFRSVTRLKILDYTIDNAVLLQKATNEMEALIEVYLYNDG